MQFHSQDAGGFRAAPNQLIRRRQCRNPSAGWFTTLRKTKYSRAARKFIHTANLCNLEVSISDESQSAVLVGGGIGEPSPFT
jgi:hypothetical protein